MKSFANAASGAALALVSFAAGAAELPAHQRFKSIDVFQLE